MIYEFGEPSTMNEKPIRYCRIKNLPCHAGTLCGCAECKAYRGHTEETHQCVSAHTQSPTLPGMQLTEHWYQMWAQSEREKAKLAAEVLALREQINEAGKSLCGNEMYVDW